jgi:hypothetical protein
VNTENTANVPHLVQASQSIVLNARREKLGDVQEGCIDKELVMPTSLSITLFLHKNSLCGRVGDFLTLMLRIIAIPKVIEI